MKLEFIEQLNIDYVESDNENPWQCKFDISQTNADMFVIMLDDVISGLFNADKIASPPLFTTDANKPVNVTLKADGTGITVMCKDKYYSYATCLGFDSKDGAKEGELEETVVDDVDVTEFGLNLDGTMISAVTGDVTNLGGQIKIVCDQPVSATNCYVWYMDINGTRYYGKVPCVIDGENTIELDRFVTMGKYKV